MFDIPYDYYLSQFRRGNDGGIPENEYLMFVDRAYISIDTKNATLSDSEKQNKRLWWLVLEVAELLYIDSLNPRNGDIISESNAGFSVTLKSTEKSNAEVEKDIQMLVKKRLKGTSFAYKFIRNLMD